MDKAPAFQFYTGDWLSSTAITLMTPAEEGAYIRLLAYMWNDPDCGLPDNLEKLTALSRLSPTDKGVIGSILACFEKHPSKKGFLTNKRLLEEKKKQEEWRKHQREAGIKGMESRWNPKKKKHNKTITSLLPKHNPSSSSSSSSSSSIKKENIETPPSGKKPPDPRVKVFIDYISMSFEKKTGESMHIHSGKDGAIIKSLLQTYDLPKLQSLWDIFIVSTDPFIVKAGFTIGVFRSQINKLTSQPPPKKDWRNNPEGIKSWKSWKTEA